VAVRVKLPDVPVMVNVAAPMVAELLVVSVKVLVLVEFAGLKDAVTPLGRLESVRLTLPVKPFWSFTVMVLVPLLPRGTPKVLGLADSVKFGGCAAPETAASSQTHKETRAGEQPDPKQHVGGPSHWFSSRTQMNTEGLVESP